MDYQSRVNSFQNTLKGKGIDGAFLTRRPSIGYFTGAFAPWSSALYIPADGDPVTFTFIVDAPRITADSYYKDVRGWSDYTGGLMGSITGIIKDQKLEKSKIGFEIGTSVDVGVLSAGEYLTLKEICPDIKVENVINEITQMQLIKTEDEIELLRRAAESVDLGMKYAYDAMCIGMTETELAGYAELGMRKAGHMFNWCVTGTEIGAGYRQSYKNCFTSIPGHKRIQYGEIVTIDIHSMYDLYISDLALNAIIGVPTTKQRKLADDWKRLVEYLFAQIKPGAVCDSIFSTVWAKATEMGIDQLIIPSFSHGLGLDARIPPAIGPGNMFVLEENMVVELIMQMTEPLVGGMRLEYPVVVRSHGAEPLCKTPIDLRIKEF